LNKGQATWVLSYAFLAYVFLSEVPQLSGLSVFSVQAAFVLLVVLYLASSFVNWGVEKASIFLFASWLISYAIEYTGVTTGYPFGSYAYTSAMGSFVGPVPVFIPFLWCALGYFCLQATGPSMVAPAMLMVLLDLSLDPLFSQSLWHWQSTAGPYYYGVPALNFVGWFVTAILIFTFFMLAVREYRSGIKANILVSGGSAAGVGFYLLFGVTTILYQLYSGLAGGAALTSVLYAVAGVYLWNKAKQRAVNYAL